MASAVVVVQMTSGDIITSFFNCIKNEIHLKSLTRLPNFNLLDIMICNDKKHYAARSLKLCRPLVHFFRVTDSTCHELFNQYETYNHKQWGCSP